MYRQIKIGDIVSYINMGIREQFIVKDAYMPKDSKSFKYEYRIGKPDSTNDLLWIKFEELELV